MLRTILAFIAVPALIAVYTLGYREAATEWHRTASALAATPALADEAKPVTITATQQEAQALVQLIDQAVKACGLQCAQNGLFWAQKLQNAFTASTQSPAPVPEAKPPAK